jgi:hypothetical protein
MKRQIVFALTLCATAACAGSNASREAATEAERVRDRTNTRAPASANDNAPVNQGIDEVRSRSDSNAQDPK